MPECYLIPSLATDLLIVDLESQAAQLAPEFGASLGSFIKSDSSAQFVLGSARLETLMAAVPEEEVQEWAGRAEGFARSAAELFSEFRDRIVLIDIEDASGARREAYAEFANANGLPVAFEDLMGESNLPDPLLRLLWQERKNALSPSVLEAFSTLDACTLSLYRGNTNGILDGVKLLSERRQDLLFAVSESMARLESELERSRLSEEISELTITLLQEELESTTQSEWFKGGGEQPSSEDESSPGQYARAAGSAPSAGLGKAPKGLMPALWTLKLWFEPKTRTNKKLIEASGLFDSEWYVSTYPDVAEGALPPAIHYLKHGAAEGRDPSPQFSTKGYLWRNPDIDPMKVNPLVHSISNKPQSE